MILCQRFLPWSLHGCFRRSQGQPRALSLLVGGSRSSSDGAAARSQSLGGDPSGLLQRLLALFDPALSALHQKPAEMRLKIVRTKALAGSRFQGRSCSCLTYIKLVASSCLGSLLDDAFGRAVDWQRDTIKGTRSR